MALNYTRLLCRRNFDLRNFRCLYTSHSTKINTTVATLSSTKCESHDEKNMRLKRPMSPHLGIYQVQLTWMLSLTHRTTGIILSSYAMILGFGTLFIPGGIPYLIESIANWGLPAALIMLGKTIFAFPLAFHYLSGLRHLAWDLGKFLTIKQVYSTGWTVVALSLIAAVGLACL